MTVKMMMSMLISANVLAFASLSLISLFRLQVVMRVAYHRNVSIQGQRERYAHDEKYYDSSPVCQQPKKMHAL